MRKYSYLFLSFIFLFGYIKAYQTPHFRIYSNMHPKYILFIENNAEAYYESMVPEYFPKGFNRPLAIYYSQTLSDSKKLLRSSGFDDDIDYGIYKHTIPAVYTHRDMENGSISGWGTLFHEITHHFIHINYDNCPAWFNEGLASFLGERSKIVKGHLKIGYPNPWRDQILRDSIENGEEIDIKKLVSLSDHEFGEWKMGRHISRTLFYWLYEIKQLKNYMMKVKEKGYGIEVLEEMLFKSNEELNSQFLAFIKKNCYAGAYVKDAQDAEDPIAKKKAYLKALALKPDYQQAQLELADYFYKNRELEKCRKHLIPILKDTESKLYVWAAVRMGDTYYFTGNYSKALEYYHRAWEYSDYDEYKYSTAYSIACCYDYMGDIPSAKTWFRHFLQYNWVPESTQEMINYAKGYPYRKDAYRGKRDYNAAISDYNKAIKNNPNDAFSYNALGHIYFKKGMFDEAIEMCKKALSINKNFKEPYINIGNAYLGKNMRDKALDEFKKAMKVDPNYAKEIGKDYDKAYYNLGCKYAEKGMLDEAIEEYQVSIVINPNFSWSHYNLACAYARKNEKEKAIQNLKKAVELEEKLREEAKRDESFINIRNEREFQELISKK